jgi:VWFA-related protein
MPSAKTPLSIAAAIALALAVPIATGAAGGTQAPPSSQSPQGAPQPQMPLFRSGVDLVAVDVQVVDHDGRPTLNLNADQFQVEIDGHKRQVVRADLFRYAQGRPGQVQRITDDLPAERPQGRLFILAVDQLSFRMGAARVAAQVARGFIDRLQPDDAVGLYVFPGSSNLNFTHERASVRAALNKIVGLQNPVASEFHLSISEIIDITAADGFTLTKVVARECRPTDVLCQQRVQGEAFQIGAMAESQIAIGFAGLSRLLTGLRYVPVRKTMVLISGGLLASDRGNGRPDMRARTQELGREAAAANTNLYVIHLDNSFTEAYAPDREKTDPTTQFRDSSVLRQGLENLADAAGGAVFKVEAGSPDSAFDRVMRETSAYYMLGLEVSNADRDGKPHYITVDVKQHGVTVRNRPMVVIPKSKS